MAHLTNFSFEFFNKIFTEDASLPLLYHGAKKSLKLLFFQQQKKNRRKPSAGIHVHVLVKRLNFATSIFPARISYFHIPSLDVRVVLHDYKFSNFFTQVSQKLHKLKGLTTVPERRLTHDRERVAIEELLRIKRKTGNDTLSSTFSFIIPLAY